VIEAQRRQDRRTWLPDPIGTAALMAAMLSKPSATMIPLTAAIIDRFVLGRSWRDVMRSCAVWVALAVPIMIVAAMAQDAEGVENVPPWARLFVAGDSLTFYLYKLFFPKWLGIDYGRRPAVIAREWWFYVMWIVPLIIAILVARSRRQFPWMTASALIVLAALLPVLGLVTFLFQFTSTTADHYLYLAMLGPALALAFALRELATRRTWIIAILVIAFLGFRSLMQTQVWRDHFTLFSNAVYVNPRSALAHNNLGFWYSQHGESEAAMFHFRQAIAVDPQYSDAYENLASYLYGAGDVQGAIDAMRKVIEIRSRLPAHRYVKRETDRARLDEVLRAATTRSNE
jgi:hypothetical protein